MHNDIAKRTLGHLLPNCNDVILSNVTGSERILRCKNPVKSLDDYTHARFNLLYFDSSTASTDSDKATLFSSYFHSIFSSSQFNLPTISNLIAPVSSFGHIDITGIPCLYVVTSFSRKIQSLFRFWLQGFFASLYRLM